MGLLKQYRNRVGGLSVVMVCGWMVSLSTSALTEATSDLFSGAGNCAFCHEQWSRALLDSKGENVSITGDWRVTMMAHSFIDPLWRARMEAEVADRPELKGFIEDKCLNCHAPMARTQHRHDTETLLSMDQALKMELASEGVSCTLCHQIQAGNLGEESSSDGGYKIGDGRRIYGPYTNVVTMPMRHHVDYTPGFGKQIQQSEMCATCHTLFTPILNKTNETEGLFPEQVPYLEWKNSVYPKQNQQCQDCHMPRLDEPIQIAARPPWIGTREPFWRHAFLGANTFMMQLLANPDNELDTLADSESFKKQIDRTREYLRNKTARLSIVPGLGNGELLLRVKVENLAGHKFPSGYPCRRAWLRVHVQDAGGGTVFQSGSFNADGRLKNSHECGFAPHYEEITSSDQVQVYQAIMGDAQNKPTTYLLRATHYLKDNRIPPKGFRTDGPYIEKTAVSGAAAVDSDYSNGKGSDTTLYCIAVPPSQKVFKIRVDLLYQPVPPESVDLLLTSELDDAKAFSRLYRKADKTPEIVQTVSLTLNAPN